MSEPRVALGLGANLNDPVATLRKAVERLPLSSPTASSLFESNAMLPENAPADWARPFFNLVVAGSFPGSPKELLKSIKDIEKTLGRSLREYWAPREIDIDILCFGETQLISEDLTIPHIGLCERPFALLPLAEVMPNWVCPTAGPWLGKTAAEIAKRWEDAFHLPFHTKRSMHAL